MRLLPLCALLLAPSVAAQSQLVGWHADGQTWLVWKDDLVLQGGDTYEVYRSNAPITDLASATLAGRLFPPEWRAERLHRSHPGATWTIPDGAGGQVALPPSRALFVYTPRVATSEYFAVVATGQTGVGPGNTTGPIAQTTAPVTCHPQQSGLDDGHPYTVFCTWIDGDDHPAAGRVDFPVMGDSGARGTAHLFAVFWPEGTPPPGALPAAFAMHGGSGSYWDYRPSRTPEVELDLHVQDGLLVTLDDSLYTWVEFSPGQFQLDDNSTRFFGYWPGYDRFSGSSAPPPDGSTVVNFSQRRVDFTMDWIVSNLGADPDALSLFGMSMGGKGVALYLRYRPDRLAFAFDFVGSYAKTNSGKVVPLEGTIAQNLPSNLPGAPGMTELYLPATAAAGRDWPLTRFLHGTNDQSNGWADKPDGFRALDALDLGVQIWWDERGHTPINGSWSGAYFLHSERHDPAGFTQYRRDVSFPGFSNIDHSQETPGQQPDPGDGQTIVDPWGTWGGWTDWDASTLIDQPDLWSVEAWLTSGSVVPADDSPTPFATCDLTLRRVQSFEVLAGTPYQWQVLGTGGAVLQRGVVRASEVGLTLEGVLLRKAPVRVEVRPLGVMPYR